MTFGTLVIYYVLAVAVNFIMLKIYEKYSDHKLKITWKNFSIVLLITLISFSNNLFSYIFFKIILSALLSFLMFKFIFNDNIKSTLYYTIIIEITLNILDLVLSFFLPTYIKNLEILNHSIFFKIGYSLSVNFILFIIIANRYVVNFFKKLKQSSKNYKILYFIGFFELIICTIWIVCSYQNTYNKPLHIILSITELSILAFIILILKNKFDRNILEIKDEQLKQNLDLYTKVALEYKEMKHNLMNDFLTIKTKLAKKDQEFINDIINKYRSSYDWINDVTDIPEGLQGLVFLKKNQAELKKIHFNLEYNITKNVEEIFAINQNFRLYETLGILFDNAIEAASETKEKIINVLFSYQKNILKISIFNTFNNDIDLDKIGTKNYSTKNRGSGIGLNYLSRQKNKFEINQTIRNNIFIADIILKNNKKKSSK